MSNGDQGDRSGLPEGIEQGVEGAAEHAVEGTGLVDQVEELAEGALNASRGVSDLVDGGAVADRVGEATDAAGEVLGQRAIQDALSRDDAVLDDVGGLISDEGATLVETVQSLTDAGQGLVDSARGLGDSIRGVSDALGSRVESDNVNLSFECEALVGSWTVSSVSLNEQLNAPYVLVVRITSEAGETTTTAEELLGEHGRLAVDRGSAMRHISGIITEVHQAHGGDAEYETFALIISPALTLMQQRVNSLIFQDMTVPQILEKVLTAGLAPYQRSLRLDLNRDYPVCEYRTQYDETDSNFCHRLMEEEGIHYWFDFEDDAETMVLSDESRQFGAIRSTHGDSLRFSDYEGGEGGHEAITSFESVTALRKTVLRLRNYDWTHPSSPIKADSGSLSLEQELPERHSARIGSPREHYEHDVDPVTLSSYSSGSYTESDVDDQLRIRREQQLYDGQVFNGSSSVLELRAGATFAFENPPCGGDEKRYLVLSASHHYSNSRANNQFTCVPADTPYRPRRQTHKPRISSVQTAQVVGPAGQEIHTDQHGRIKVQFHWDREGSNDDHSSCYLRVMQPWAGSGWGMVFLPRIGMEVVVTFVNGDPDLPMVIGAVYNGEHLTPYALDDEKTKSVIKTQSTPGGDGYNELTFEDAAGNEQIIVHAQKDMNETVENDHSTTVHANQSNSVDGGHTESVGGKQALSVGNDRNVTIEGKQLVQVNGGESAQYVEGNYILGTTQEVTIKAPDKISIKCESSVITLEPHKITLSAGGGAILTLDQDGKLKSSQGSMVVLDTDALTQSSAQSSVRLTTNVNVKARAGASLDLTADGVVTSSGGARMSVEGPNVKLNC